MDICSKYPFLDSCRKYVPKEGFTEQYIHYSYNHLWDQAPNINFEELDVQVFLLSLIMLKNTDNTRLYRQWIANFCKRFETFFLQDIYSDVSVRNEVLPLFGLKPDDLVFYPSYCSMKNVKYLMFTRELTNTNEDFKLVNGAQKNGRVNMYYQRFVLILRQKLETIIFKRLKEKYTDNEIINQYVAKLIQDHPVRTYYKSSNMSGKFPPCIQYLVDKAKDTSDLEHQERVMLGIYLMGKEYPMDDILEIFAQLGDYKEKVTTYQLNKLKNYNCYACNKTADLGMCRKSEDKLGRCNKITNPFHY